MDEDHGATVADWLKLVRRARLGQPLRTVALYLAGKANNDGTHLYAGIARMAVECELSRAEARRALKTLRDAGLIELVCRGNRRLRKSDEYRLVIGPDVMEHFKVPSPAEHDAAIIALKDRERQQQEQRQRRHSLHRKGDHSLCDPRRCRAATTLTTTLSLSVDDGNNAQESEQQRSSPTGVGASTSPVLTSPVEATPLTDDAAVRTDLAVPRASPPEDPDQISIGGEEHQADAEPATPAGCNPDQERTGGDDDMARDRGNAQTHDAPTPDRDRGAHCANCGTFYIDDDGGHESHRVVFGHTPRRLAPVDGQAS